MNNNNITTTSSFLTSLRWGTFIPSDVAATSLNVILLISTYPAIVLVVLASIFFIYSKFITTTKNQLPPGPVPWPIIGNLPELFTKKPTFRWIEGLMKKMNTDTLCIRLGSTHIISVNSPEIAREFLKKHDAIFASRPITMGSEYASHGFLSVVVAPMGDQWKKRRRVVASEVICPARLCWLHDKRSEEADNLVRYIHNQCNNNGEVVDVRSVCRIYTVNVTKKLIFNKRYFGKGREDGGSGPEEEEKN